MEFFTIFGTFVALICAWYGYKACQFNEIEKSEGSVLDAGLFSTDGPKDIFVLLPFEKGKLFIFPITLILFNSGNKNAKNVEVFFSGSDVLFNRNQEKTISPIAKARGSQIASEKGKTQYLTNQYMSVGEVTPNCPFGVNLEVMWNEESILEDSVSFVSKEGNSLMGKYKAPFALTLKVKVLYQDASPIEKEYNLNFRQLKKNKNAEMFLKREKKQTLENSEVDRIRIVTFNGFQQVPNEKFSEKNEKFKSNLKLYQCNENSARYIDLVKGGNSNMPMMDVKFEKE